MDIQKEIDTCLRSRHTLLCLVSFEEERIVEHVKDLCNSSKRRLLTWDHADYFLELEAGDGKGGSIPTARDPLSALEAIEKIDGQVIFLLRDFHQCWDRQPRVIRKLRNVAQRLKYTRKTIIITSPSSKIPEELKDEAVIMDVPPPSFQELMDILKKLMKTPGVKMDLNKENGERLIRSALGLSSGQAQRTFAKAIVSDGVLNEDDIHLINTEKKLIIRESGALEFFSPTETVSDVGGLQALKKWVRMRESAFGQEAQDYGLPAPKGVALIGIPGTGKSLSAKVIAALWKLPLIRLDIGAVFGGLVGESEENIRRALSLAETVSPCLLWIDEIEKGLSTGDGDGGTSMRVFGTILSWMQEKQKPVFVIATANNISMLPPELLRRGRFDEIFFLDLPTDEERLEIFKVHIRKRKRDPEKFDIAKLVAKSEGYVGAEIEQAIIDAMYIAFNDEKDPHREFKTEDVAVALDKLVPMSSSAREQIADLRRWLHEGRAQSASFAETETAEQSFVQIQIEPKGAIN